MIVLDVSVGFIIVVNDLRVVFSLVVSLAGFGKGNEDCLFPDGRDLSVSVGEVEEPSKVLQAEGTKLTEM